MNECAEMIFCLALYILKYIREEYQLVKRSVGKMARARAPQEVLES